MRGWIVPLVLCRRGAVSVRSLDPLVQRRAAGLVDQVLAAEAERRALGAELSERLYGAVAAAEGAERAALLRLRRDVFNDRIPARDGVAAARRRLAEGDYDLLVRWKQSRLAHGDLVALAEHTAPAEIRAGRRALAGVAGSEALAEGVDLLSGPLAARDAGRYRDRVADAGPVPRELRKAEETLVSLAYRSALKPSPHGSVTTVGVALWQPRPDEWPADARRRVRIDQAVLDWLVRTVADPARPGFRTRIASTARIGDGRVEWFAADRFWSRTVDEKLAAVLLAPDTGAADHPEVAELVATGLLEAGIDVSEQEPGYARAAAEALATGARRVRRPFRVLAALESRYAVAAVADRPALRRELATELGAFATAHGAEPPKDVRSLIYEETVSAGGPRPADLARLSAAEPDLGLLASALPVFDDALPARIGLYRWFVDRDLPAAGTDVLDLFGMFVAEGPDHGREVLAGAGDPHAVALRRLRTWLGAHVDSWIRDSPDVVRLAPGWLAEFGDSVAEHTSGWPSATWLLQSGVVEDGPCLVLNEVRSGFGAFLARFCEPAGPATDLLRTTIARTAPRQADLTAVLGYNYNLHPDLAPLEVEYPGARARRPDALTLRDLIVFPDHDGHRLRLRSRLDGGRVDLRPLNGIHPLGAPELYRFLLLFADTAGYRGGLTDLHLASRSDHERAAGTPVPRIVLNEIVVQRRSWRFGAAAVQNALPGPGADLDLLVGARRWLRATGLPERCFFRVVEPAGPASRRRARGYKPHYLDFGSVFLLRALLRAAASAGPDALIEFQECLPDTGDYDERLRSAEEFAVEWRRGAR